MKPLVYHDGTVIRPGMLGKSGQIWSLSDRFDDIAVDALSDEALDQAAGYCVVNDVSERDFQFKLTGRWTKGKS